MLLKPIWLIPMICFTRGGGLVGMSYREGHLLMLIGGGFYGYLLRRVYGGDLP